MTTTVQICNLALAKLGNKAMVTAISPPDGSMEANYCALFYPQALAVLLTKHNWSFATITCGTSLTANWVSGGALGAGSFVVDSLSGVGLGMVASGANLGAGAVVSGFSGASVSLSAVMAGQASGAYTFSFLNAVNNNPAWAYSFSLPTDFYQVIECKDASSVGLPLGYAPVYGSGYGAAYGLSSAVEYAYQGGVLYSNDSNLVLTYLSNAASNFTPLFVEALAVLLASYLAGPVIKGDVGVSAGNSLLKAFGLALAMAVEDDGQNLRVGSRYVPVGVRARV